jgi:hypothetical protein
MRRCSHHNGRVATQRKPRVHLCERLTRSSLAAYECNISSSELLWVAEYVKAITRRRAKAKQKKKNKRKP